MEGMLKSYSDMEHSYREVVIMFSENPDTMEPSDFFSMFLKFTNAWKVSEMPLD